jgi:hypothetical protein
MVARYSPTIVTALIVHPLRYFFSTNTGEDLVWSKDEKVATIEIGGINDFTKIPLQKNPRILVNRGGYTIGKTGLTDNLATAPSIGSVLGASQRQNLIFIRGEASIIIEARQEGTAELIADMVSHFIVQTRPLIMSTQGFKEFANDIQISETVLDKDDREKFKITMTIPYMHEERWMVNQDAIKLKGILLDLNETIS